MPWLALWIALGASAALPVGFASAQAVNAQPAEPGSVPTDTTKRGSLQRSLSATLFPGGIQVSAGWAMGVTGDAVNPSNDRPENEKLDLAPFFHINVGFGDGAGISADLKLILANFGRLVNKAGIEGFSAEESGTAVRRALLTDFTLRSRVWTPWPSAGIALNILNTGFIFDAQSDTEGQDAIDAASYLFAGVTLVTHDRGTGALAAADLLVGMSELLTGDEVFDFSSRAHPSLRLRPRLYVRFENGLGTARPLALGFWGDLGIKQDEPDAVTAFVATELFPLQ